MSSFCVHTSYTSYEQLDRLLPLPLLCFACAPSPVRWEKIASFKPGSDGRQESLSRRGDVTRSYPQKLSSSCELLVTLSLSPKSSFPCHVSGILWRDFSRKIRSCELLVAQNLITLLASGDMEFDDKRMKTFSFSCRGDKTFLLIHFFFPIQNSRTCNFDGIHGNLFLFFCPICWGGALCVIVYVAIVQWWCPCDYLLCCLCSFVWKQVLLL